MFVPSSQRVVVPSHLFDRQSVCAAVQQIPPQISMQAAREEAEMVLFDSVRNVLEEACLKPGQVRFRFTTFCCW